MIHTIFLGLIRANLMKMHQRDGNYYVFITLLFCPRLLVYFDCLPSLFPAFSKYSLSLANLCSTLSSGWLR